MVEEKSHQGIYEVFEYNIFGMEEYVKKDQERHVD